MPRLENFYSIYYCIRAIITDPMSPPGFYLIPAELTSRLITAMNQMEVGKVCNEK